MHDSDLTMTIHRAVKQGDLSEVIRLISDDGSRLNLIGPFGNWLQEAALYGKLDIVRWLVTNGLDVNAYGVEGALTEPRPLDNAAARGHVDVVQFLIDSGATLDVSESIRNPLFAAIAGDISESQTAVAKLLIDSGIDTKVRYPNLDNMDAREFARQWGRTEIVQLLDEHR